MTEEEKLAMLRTLTGESDTDILSVYLLLAKDAVLHKAYPLDEDASKREFPAKYDTIQIKIAVYLLNKRGAEGETQHSENGILRSYEDGDIPPSLLRNIIPTAVGV